ncbi:hypothetical protein NDA14_002948 [Ustilago hordei]|nr:hypothetical protein NDA14_002948 [Ustilago hordei]
MVVPTTTKAPHSGPKLPHQAPLESIIKDKPSQKLIISLSLRLRRGQITTPEAVSEATAKSPPLCRILR